MLQEMKKMTLTGRRANSNQKMGAIAKFVVSLVVGRASSHYQSCTIISYSILSYLSLPITESHQTLNSKEGILSWFRRDACGSVLIYQLQIILAQSHSWSWDFGTRGGDCHNKASNGCVCFECLLHRQDNIHVPVIQTYHDPL